MFNWLKKHQRQKILQQPFPASWKEILSRRVLHYCFLDDAEKQHLQQLVQVFIAEKQFEGCNNLIITDEIKVVIAAEACMLVLGLPHDLYNDLSSVLVYPSTVVVPPAPIGVFTTSPLIARGATPIDGQAFLHGPVIIVWDEARKEARHPETGHNVVYHEFAHLLDMEDGVANGTPILHSREQYSIWAKVFSQEFLALRRDAERGIKTFLDPYGALNEAEFFAVATEFFFDKPMQMQKTHQILYDILANFYQQHPAARELRYRKKRGLSVVKIEHPV